MINYIPPQNICIQLYTHVQHLDAMNLNPALWRQFQPQNAGVKIQESQQYFTDFRGEILNLIKKHKVKVKSLAKNLVDKSSTA